MSRCQSLFEAFCAHLLKETPFCVPCPGVPILTYSTLSRPGYRDFVFAFHDGEEIGASMLAGIAKHTGFYPNGL
jgi:hypothetical protein